MVRPFRFRFQFLDDDGDATTLWTRRGVVDGATLDLAGQTVPATTLESIEAEGRTITLMLLGGERGPTLRLKHDGIAPQLERALAAARVVHRAERHRAALAAAGRVGEGRLEPCPDCGAPVILSGRAETPQLWCEACGALAGRDALTRQPGELRWRHCAGCGLFADPRECRVFYPHRLFAGRALGERIQRCSGCLRGILWRMLALNVPFVVGLPVALWRLFRFRWLRPGPAALRPLRAANRRLLKGDADAAIAGYQGVLEQLRVSAGVRTNLARALAARGDADAARAELRRALGDCANHGPTFDALASLATTDEERAALAVERGGLEAALPPAPAPEPAPGHDDAQADAPVAEPLTGWRRAVERTVDGLLSVVFAVLPIPIVRLLVAAFLFFWLLPLYVAYLWIVPDTDRGGPATTLYCASYWVLLIGLLAAAALLPGWPGAAEYPDLGPTGSRLASTYIALNIGYGALLIAAVIARVAQQSEDAGREQLARAAARAEGRTIDD